jgi:tetratricopeptide (TPR) repeat protein
MPTEPAPFVSSTIFLQNIRSLPEPPPALSEEEQGTLWATEYELGKQFASRADYYRAITCFQRASFLVKKNNPTSSRIAQMTHASLLSYSLGGKHQEAVDLWEQECDSFHSQDIKLTEDIIGLVFESYCRIGRQSDGYRLISSIPDTDPLKKRLPLFHRIAANDENLLLSSQETAKHLGDDEQKQAAAIIDEYRSLRKNPQTACILNGILPGTGYLYVGQPQTALTSTAFNTAFIVAAVQLFTAHQPAAAIIATGFEVGWYCGGVMGAGMAAESYNQRLREKLAKAYLNHYKLFPLQMVHYKW